MTIKYYCLVVMDRAEGWARMILNSPLIKWGTIYLISINALNLATKFLDAFLETIAGTGCAQ